MVENQKSKDSQKDKIIAIIGPTATGKTKRAVEIAKHFGGEIISADSRQVYRGMDLGTGKDIEEYSGVPYHLLDICEAGEKYNLHKFVRDFNTVLPEIRKRNKLPVLCGGTGMYMETVLSGVKLPDVPENPALREILSEKSLEELSDILRTYKILHNSTDIDTHKRAIRAIEIEEYYRTHPEEAGSADRNKTRPLNSVIIGIDIPRDIRREKISIRLKKRLEEGMVEEVEILLSKGIPPEDLIYYGLEYKFLTLYVIGALPYKRMVEELEIAIHQFAKRQMTWFRGMERRGFKINWLPFDMDKKDFIENVEKLLYL